MGGDESPSEFLERILGGSSASTVQGVPPCTAQNGPAEALIITEAIRGDEDESKHEEG